MTDTEAFRKLHDECLEVVKEHAVAFPAFIARAMAIAQFQRDKAEADNERLRSRVTELETICGGLTKLYQDTLAVRGLLEKLEARFASEGQEGDRE